MALPMLINGADCGPINPLQSLGKRFDQDRGIQQDQFSAGRTSSSRQTFHTQTTAAPGFNEDAARFFSGQQQQPASMSSFQGPAQMIPSFDMANIRHALPPPVTRSMTGSSAPLATSAAPALAASAWAADFLTQSPMLSNQASQSSMQGKQVNHAPQASTMPTFQPQYAGGMGMQPMQMPGMGMMNQSMISQPQQADMRWEDAFLSLAQPQSTNISQTAQGQQQQQQPLSNSQRTLPSDELALTAGVLLDSVAHDTSTKFQNSQFLGLMRQLRDGELTVEGNEVVPRGMASGSGGVSADIKGKGRAQEPMSMSMPMSTTTSYGTPQGIFPYAPRGTQPMANAETSAAQRNASGLGTDMNSEDAYWQQENAEYIQYWNNAHPGMGPQGYRGQQGQRNSQGQDQQGRTAPNALSAQQAEWGHLQDDWDAYEATATGIRRVSNYQFQAHNPYVLGNSSRGAGATRQHSMHTHAGHVSMYDNVLEMEAAVQRDPTNPDLWCALGVRQQENEREQKAIQALQRALELQPVHGAARLALAVSLTNEGNRGAAVDALYEWAVRLPGWEAVRNKPVNDGGLQRVERASLLVDALLEVATIDTSEEIDADIQIALAVLLNTNEDWEKSGDCFRTALQVRPDDWLLWNRVGATLANSGHADQALEYYARAIEMNPLYIRARYNMGIALSNLKRYGDAAEYFLDALVMQEADATRDMNGLEDRQGLTSGALWDSLKSACNRMQRSDLSSMCERRDLEGFRGAFETGGV